MGPRVLAFILITIVLLLLSFIWWCSVFSLRFLVLWWPSPCLCDRRPMSYAWSSSGMVHCSPCCCQCQLVESPVHLVRCVSICHWSWHDQSGSVFFHLGVSRSFWGCPFMRKVFRGWRGHFLHRKWRVFHGCLWCFPLHVGPWLSLSLFPLLLPTLALKSPRVNITSSLGTSSTMAWGAW